MAFLDQLGITAEKVADAYWQKRYSDEGFEDGANGKHPRIIFALPTYKPAYDLGYERGQKASVARAISDRLSF